MHTRIEQIYPKDIPGIEREFFSTHYSHEQLGKPGQWLGTEWRKVGLKNPVQLENLELNFDLVKWVSGQRRNRPDAPVGWRVTFNARQHESTFWALGSAGVKRMAEGVLISGVTGAVQFLDEKVLGAEPKHGKDNEPGGLYAMFLSGAAPLKFPRLQATVLIPRCHVRPEGDFVSFKQNLTKLDDMIWSAYESSYRDLFSDPHRDLCSKCRVAPPSMIFPPPLSDQLIREQIPDSWAQSSRRLGGENLFRAWHMQGTARGFGPKEAEALIISARRSPAEGKLNAPARWFNRIRSQIGVSEKQDQTQSQGRSR